MTKIRTLSRAAAAVLLIAALAVPAAAATSASTTDIGTDKAKSIALSHAGITESDTLFLTVEPDYDDGRLEYEVEFYDGTTEYDYTIDGKTGTVLKFDTELEWYSPDDDAGYGWKNVIGKQKAQEIALAQAGVSADEAQRLVVKPDWDDGLRIYEVEFVAGGREYDFEIDAGSGTILSQDSDAEYAAVSTGSSASAASASGTASSTSGTADIGEAKARSIALSHAGISESSASYIYAKKDRDDGRWVYDVEFWAGNKEYDYEILASDGTILSYDYDAEYAWSGSSAAAGDVLSESEVKDIVTSRAGVSGTFRELKLDRDDGRTVYEGEMYSDGIQYEFEIDASTGTVLDWDVDRD